MEPNETEVLDDLKKSVSDLAEAVEGMKEGLVDEEAVERVATAVVEKQIAANPALRRRNGPMPTEDDDVVDEDGEPVRASTGLIQKTLKQGGAHRLRLLQLGRIDREKRAPLVAKTERIAKAAGVSVDFVEEYRDAANKVALIGAFCSAYGKGGRTEGVLPLTVQETSFFQDEFLPLAQAMDSTTAAEGDEFVPTELSPNLIDRVNLELMVVSLFPMAEMPTQPWEIPGRSVGRVRGGKVDENTADTGQVGFPKITPGTRKVTLSAIKLAVEALVSKELEEDSLIAILPFVEEEIVDYLAADWEDATVNADSTNPHQDSDVTDFTNPSDPRTAWDGLRVRTQAGAKTDVGNVAPTVLNTLRANRAKMGKYGVRPSRLAHLLSMKAFIQLLADTNVLTLEKYGPNATILQGELGQVDGSPLVVSEFVRQDLNATGVHDGVTTNRTIAQTVFPRGYLFGSRRALTVQVLRELYAEFDQDAVIASHRKAFQSLYPTSELTTATAFNIAAA